MVRGVLPKVNSRQAGKSGDLTIKFNLCVDWEKVKQQSGKDIE